MSSAAADAGLFGGGGRVGHNHDGAVVVDGEEGGNSEEVVGIDARGPALFKHAISSPASSTPDPPRLPTRPISSTTSQAPPPPAAVAPQAGVVLERQQTEETSSMPDSWLLPVWFSRRSRSSPLPSFQTSCDDHWTC
jgi:hypothetical protein